MPHDLCCVSTRSGATWHGRGNGFYGKLLTYTDPNSKQTSYGYDSNANLNQITDPNSQVTKLVYDTSHRVKTITFGQGSSVAGTYTFPYHAGNTVVTDLNNHTTTYYYDSQNRLTKVTDALSNSVQYSWTADNHVQQVTDAKNQNIKYGYDGNNNLTSVQLPTGATTSRAYTDGNHPYYPTSTTDPQGNTTSYTYDANGNVKTVTNQLPSQNQTQLFYNANGTVDHVIDVRGNTTGFQFDSKGNLTKITPPSFTPGPNSQAMGPTTITPDALSRPSSATDGNGYQTSYTYDPLDRITKLQYPDGSISYTPDADGNLLTMADSTGTTSYQYDARNRQTQRTLPGNVVLQYAYDPASNLTSYSDAGGAVTYHYNAADELDWLKEPGGAQTNFQYDPNHNRTSTAYPDGVVQTQTYDTSQRLSSIVAKAPNQTTMTSFSYRFTKPGGGDTLLPYSYTENDSLRNVTATQAFDQLNRLTSWVVQSGGTVVHSYTYQFDGVSNRTQVIAEPVNSQGQIVANPSQGLPHSNESDLSFNAASEISQIVAYNVTGSSSTTALYSYDAAGNQTGNDGAGNPNKALTITYYPTNQTKSITNTSQAPVTMTWAGPGQSERTGRSWSTFTAGFTYSLVGGSGRTDTSKTPATSYFVRDPYGTLVAQHNSDSTEYYYLFDGQGNVVAIEDPGTIVGSYDLCPTGNITNGQTQQALNQPYRLGSGFYDDDTKDYFLSSGLIVESDAGIATQWPGAINTMAGLATYWSAQRITAEQLPTQGPVPYSIAPYKDQPSPRAGLQAHHIIQNAWAIVNVPGYDPGLAPSILLPKMQHYIITVRQNVRQGLRVADSGNGAAWSSTFTEEEGSAYADLQAAGVPEGALNSAVDAAQAYFAALEVHS